MLPPVSQAPERTSLRRRERHFSRTLYGRHFPLSPNCQQRRTVVAVVFVALSPRFRQLKTAGNIFYKYLSHSTDKVACCSRSLKENVAKAAVVATSSEGSSGTYFILFGNSQLSALYSTVESRTEMTIITTVRYQGNALTDTFNANRAHYWFIVHTSTDS